MERIMLTFGGRGTSTQVFLLMRALYSSHITCFQLGISICQWKGTSGLGDGGGNMGSCIWSFTFTIPTLERVTIGCCEVDGGGGGGGELFGGRVFGGSVVFSGDGVGNRVRGMVRRQSAMGDCVKNYHLRIGQGIDIHDDCYLFLAVPYSCHALESCPYIPLLALESYPHHSPSLEELVLECLPSVTSTE
ncbi:hypothetical protein Tco_1045665 [Tanacetum coccineum]|uniref:Uncharacterized protein n=1 Tax=Tanacetum coccineum TaxID=301880 RepID=A0ABQ5GU99_9ASTR